MYHPRLKGSHYEMGTRYGSVLYKNGFRFPEIPNHKIEFGMEGLEDLTHFYPEIVEEMKAFAKAVHTPFENVAGLLLSMGVFDMEGQCSIFAFRNGENVIFGRNYDFLFSHRNYCESALICPENKKAFLAQGDVFIGKMDGVNQSGLAIGMNFVNGQEKKPGISFSLLVRYVLEHCSTTDEAIKILLDTPICSTNNYLIADKSGNIAAVEVTPSHRWVRKPIEGQNYIYTTNQFLSKEMKTFDLGGNEWSKSRERTAGLDKLLKNKRILSLEMAKAILSNRSCHLCMELKSAQFGTLYSFISQLNDLEIQRAERKPTPNNYKEDLRLRNYLFKKKLLD
ncbi:C45 family autoproteolytic acyltransferase/hydolase [Xanthovirga aplysinae]|uniref:C45 family autoproteolytic acyltransferase/hydolase n=1 Tax=Xanthovirga aplysinae TaxID=2529853 RepID=UPI0012BB61DB|nr:C45 family peptidase [Xanthovirga aplysinae]MTI31993.1 hypothetical protein [Xanthovirga aplysinae]